MDQNGKPLRVMYLCMCNMTVGGQNRGRSASKWAERGWVQALRKSRRATARKEGVGGGGQE